MNNSLNTDDLRLKRLHFRSWHRGMKETDLILGSFADARLHTLNDVQLTAYEALLDLDDDMIWNWITAKDTPPTDFAEIITMLEGYGRHT